MLAKRRLLLFVCLFFGLISQNNIFGKLFANIPFLNTNNENLPQSVFQSIQGNSRTNTPITKPPTTAATTTVISTTHTRSTLKTNIPNGALISVDFKGEIGILLDEIPSVNGIQSEIIQFIRKKVSDQSWRRRVREQIRLTKYRQIFRVVIYPTKRQLTVPPEELWKIKFTSEPQFKVIQNHSIITRTYTFHSVLVAPADTVNISEPDLVPIGGKYSDYWIVPVDPYHLFQRTGYACANELGFSADTVTSQNIWLYYDYSCKPEPPLAPENRTYDANNARCHWTSFPNETCIEALEKNVGYTYINITWTRLEWSEEKASKWRFGNQTTEYADLEGNTVNLKNDISIVYRYFDENSCTLKEGGTEEIGGCIYKAGWRRVLRFTSTAVNTGKTEIMVGDVKKSLYIENGMFEFDPCHLHYHFQHYGNFKFGESPGRKTGFCLQSTWRYHNNEWTSLNSPYDTCAYQGISPGWGDDYVAGLDCQWIDITDMKPGTYNLSDQLNPDKFLCEGESIYSNGTLQFIPTEFKTSDGKPVNRPACNFTTDFDKNNNDIVSYKIDKYSSMVTLPCNYPDQISPKKDCGFKTLKHKLSCIPGTVTELEVKNYFDCKSCVTILRICESSFELDRSTACEYQHALSNDIIISDFVKTIRFVCPSARSSSEKGGRFSILASSLKPNTQNIGIEYKIRSDKCLFGFCWDKFNFWNKLF